MEPFNVIFEYLPAHQIAICMNHQQGIVKSQLKAHLNKKHQEYVPSTRRSIVKAVQKDTSLQQWAATQDEVVYPSAMCTPLPHLPVYCDGLRCERCGYINRSTKRIQEHCKQEHGRESRSRVGRPSDKQRMWTTVSCQKFHNTNKLGRLFQVGGEAEGPRVPDNADADVSQAIEMSLTQAMIRLEDAEKEKSAAIEADTDRYDFNEWLNQEGGYDI
jgi:hypothetical protein